MQEQTAHMRSMILYLSTPRGKGTILANRKSVKLMEKLSDFRRVLSAFYKSLKPSLTALSAGRETKPI